VAFVNQRNIGRIAAAQDLAGSANPNPHGSFVEFVCSYPDEGQLLQGQKEGWLSGERFAVMSELRETLPAYTPPGRNYHDHATILNDPKWHFVVEAAERAKQLLLSQPVSERERRALAEEIQP
jgi:hypothetical protein